MQFFSSTIFVNIVPISVLRLPDSHIRVGKLILGSNHIILFIHNIFNKIIKMLNYTKNNINHKRII